MTDEAVFGLDVSMNHVDAVDEPERRTQLGQQLTGVRLRVRALMVADVREQVLTALRHQQPNIYIDSFIHSL